jgi:hypothetical protein
MVQNLKEIWDPKQISERNKMTLWDSNGKVKIQGHLTEAFGIGRSLKPDYALSTTLFSVVLEKRD